MVTADSDRYVKVDISVAKTALHIRELILKKVSCLVAGRTFDRH